MKKDLFISHASEDKDDFVRPLSYLLREYGVDVWYDEFELRIGRSISRSIDKGISNSNYGLIVLSESFFNKNWTEYELRSFNSYEVDNGDVLLPIWKEVDAKLVRDFSPYLADKFALTTEKSTIEEIALKVIEVAKPDLFTNIHQKLAIEETLKNAKIETASLKELKPGPIRHFRLNANLISRIRLIRSSLWLCYPHSMDFWLDGFKRDLNIEKEIRFWEHISTCFLELLFHEKLRKSIKGKEEDAYKDIFELIFAVIHKDKQEEMEIKFNADFIEVAKDVISYNLPIYDIKEKLPFVGKETVGEGK